MSAKRLTYPPNRMFKPLRYIYTDERATLGHFVEHVWMSAELLSRMRSLMPSNPPHGA